MAPLHLDWYKCQVNGNLIKIYIKIFKMITSFKHFIYKLIFPNILNKDKRFTEHLINDLVDTNLYSDILVTKTVENYFDKTIKKVLKDSKVNNNYADLLEILANSERKPQYLPIINSIAQKYFENTSFSQCGEDIIIKFLFDYKKVNKPSYIDVGAYDPFHYSNTALLYLNGSRGINVEPNPENFKNFVEFRTEDINLNVGIADKDGYLDYYFIDAPTLNTFSKESVEEYKKNGHSVVSTTKIPVITMENALKKSIGKFPDLLTLDAEGVDEIILESIDYSKDKPKVICVETLSYSREGKGKKNHKLIEFIQSKNYILFADTYINSIFVDKDFLNS